MLWNSLRLKVPRHIGLLGFRERWKGKWSLQVCACAVGASWVRPGNPASSVTAFVCWSQQLLERWVAISWDCGLSASLCHSAFLFWLSLLESMLLSTHKFKIAVSSWKIQLFNIIKWPHIYLYIHTQYAYTIYVHIYMYICYTCIYTIFTYIQYTHNIYVYRLP